MKKMVITSRCLTPGTRCRHEKLASGYRVTSSNVELILVHNRSEEAAVVWVSQPRCPHRGEGVSVEGVQRRTPRTVDTQKCAAVDDQLFPEYRASGKMPIRGATNPVVRLLGPGSRRRADRHQRYQ